MSSGIPENPFKERSALGAALGFEFECSFSAAEANEAVYALAARREQGRRNRELDGDDFHIPFKKIHILGSESGLQETEWIELSWPLDEEVALLQPIQKDRQETVSQSLLTRTVNIRYTEEKGEPVLAALFDDIALPLATFARRKDGRCSYVQIGSEIKDDSYHVLATDDRTGRNLIIDAVRMVVDTEYFSALDEDQKKQRSSALKQLIEVECKQSAELLAAGFEGQFIRKCMNEVSSKGWQKLLVMDESGNASETKFKTAKFLEETELNDNRRVELIIASPEEGPNQDIAYIFAKTRGLVALPIATLNSSTRQIKFENPGIDEPEKELVIEKFLAILKGKTELAHSNGTRAIMLESFDVQSRFAEFIGPTTDEEEQFASMLYKMRLGSSDTYTGIINDLIMNNTVADAYFQVRVDREETWFNVTVSGKPAAMRDEKLKVLQPFCFSFDVTKPIKDQLDGTREHIGELMAVFSKLTAIKS